ncbi:MAG: response regulator, partial [Desulfobacteraceae bacterium]|nr:response regulator [Desulfobacteraceae bacterium]
GMDGYEVCRRLKADTRTRNIPVLFISGLAGVTDKIKGFSVGAMDYIAKPFYHEEVLARVKTHVSLSRANKRLEEQNVRLQKEIKERMQAGKELRKSHDELSQALAELKRTQVQMLQSEKMASIGQLAAGVAHEINNPAGFINSNFETLMGYQKDANRFIEHFRILTRNLMEVIPKEKLSIIITDLVEQMVSLEDEIDIDYIQKDSLDIIKECREGIERIKNIVIDLRDFARPGEKGLVDTDINKGIESTLNVVWNELKYKTKVTKDYGDLPLIKGYARQLNQAFMNILINAAHAILEQGEIKILTLVNSEKGYVEIRITDDGVGIPKENISKIFDPFFTTRDVGKGTGLGLNVAYNIVKKHNGTIDVDSTPGVGTTFVIRIPF